MLRASVTTYEKNSQKTALLVPGAHKKAGSPAAIERPGLHVSESILLLGG